MRIATIVVFLTLTSLSVAAAKMPVRGAIQGRVVRAATGQPLIEAGVRVVQTGRVVRTDVDGAFRVEVLPGTYQLRVFYDIYQPQRISRVVVLPGRVTTVNVVLRHALDSVIRVVVEVDAVKSTVAALIAERKKAAASSDAVSAEQISKSPDSTASDAVKRVVGATVVGGRYVYIRGLGERYTNTLLNGAFLPSSEPDRPAVPLNVFPAALLANITLNKTFTPDMPGDFAGGSLNINTREFPEKFTLKVSLKGGINTESSFREHQTYPGGTDYFGFDDGTRALPGGLLSSRAGRLGGGEPPLSRTQLTEMAESFRRIWSPRRLQVGVDHGLGVTVGGTSKLGGTKRLGYLASLDFSKKYQRRIKEITALRVVGAELGVRETLRQEEGTEGTLWGGLANVGLRLSARHKLSFVSLFSHSTTDRTQLITGREEQNATNIQTSRLRFITQALWFNMLQGRHKLGGPTGPLLKWQINFARTTRAEPDTRDLLYEEVPGIGFRYRNQPGSGERFYSNLAETGGGGGADLTLPFAKWTLKTGFVGRLSRRGFIARRFRFIFDGGDPSILLLPPESLFARPYLEQQIRLDERTLAADKYDADVLAAAGYLMADLHSIGPVRFVGGVRFELYRQELTSGNPFAFFTEDVPGVARTDADFLPSLNVIWPINDKMNLRGSYGQTVARPQLRELAPFLFFDFTRRRNVQGNPNVNRTLIFNGDLRWEYFPGAGQVIAASVFAKYFSSPIERVLFNANGDVKFDNAASARTLGVEIEASTRLGFLHKSLENLTVGFNLLLATSTVSLSEEQKSVQTNPERSMQGQSPYVINFGLTYSRPKWGSDFSLLYNVAGERLVDVGISGLPDVFERPFHRLDFSYSQRMGKHWRLKLTGKNVLNQPVSLRQGGRAVLRYRPGMSAGLSVGYSF